MPHHYWQNACCSPDTWSGSPTTWACQSPIRRARWGLTMHESMLRYQLHYGLKPVGAHRRLADELFRPVQQRCSQCDGGLIAINDGDDFAICTDCSGFGARPLPGAPELLRLRQEILKQFPSSGAEPPSTASAARLLEAIRGAKVVIHNLGTGLIDSQ